VLAQTAFQPRPSISWSPTVAQVRPQDLLVYFVDDPKHGILAHPNAPFDAGGYTNKVDIAAADAPADERLVMQVYCIEQSQTKVRPGDYLAILAFHEMMHGRTDVGPIPPGTDHKGKLITDLHPPGVTRTGIAQFPTPPGAQLSDWDRRVMARNLHRGVPLYTGALEGARRCRQVGGGGA
jgi:hypothetical protein